MNDADFQQSTPDKPAQMTLDTAKGILQRDDEIAAAKKKGQHREAVMQMKAFASKFRATNHRFLCTE